MEYFHRKTVIFGNTFCYIDCCLTVLPRKTEFPTGLFSSAFLLTTFKSWHTFRIFFTFRILFWTFFFNTLSWVSDHQSSRRLRLRLGKTIVCSSALGDVGGSRVPSLAQTHFPTGLSTSTLLFTPLKSRNTFGIFLASSPLVRAFLLNALLRVSNHDSEFIVFFDFK